ncbi:MAG: serine/threonine protein phosphatase, partial [Marinilabiliales bacterium]
PTIKHLHFIQTLTNIIIVAIENKRLYKESLRQQAIKKELELASKMQNMLIPSNDSLPHDDRLHVATFYHPHLEVGGDYYDFIRLSDDEFGFCIADVSGKGISAALLVSNFQANLRALFTKDISLKKLVKTLNLRINNITEGDKFITLFIAKYSYKKNVLTYINAGHNPPLIYDAEKDQIKYLSNGCTGLGMFDEIPVIKSGTLKIHPGAKLLCYTDGLVEVENYKKVEFSTDRLEDCLKTDFHINRIIENIISELDEHKGSNSYFDDISIIGIEFYKT